MFIAFTYRLATAGLLIRTGSACYMNKQEASANEKISRSEH